jgi:hypothetical protein
MAGAGPFDHLVRCFDLGEEDIARAIEDRESTLALLQRLGAISEPNGGAAKCLLVLARMATTACEWLDGGLLIDIRADGAKSRIDLTCDLGGGMRERVFPSLVVNAPLEEFTRAIERVPRMVRPLAIASKGATRIALAAAVEVRKSSLPPPPIHIAEESFYVPKAPAAPKTREADTKAPLLPVITPQLPVVDARSSARMKSSLVQPKRDPRAEPDDEEAIDAGWEDK